MKIGYLDGIVLFLYFFSVLALGLFFSGKNNTARKFMIANGGLSGIILGFSIFGTYFSSITFLVNPSKAYADNWGSIILSAFQPIAAIFCIKYIIPFYRKLGDISAYTHLEKRFGAWAGIFSSLSFVLLQIIRIGMIIYLLSLCFSSLVGVNENAIILATGIIVMLYTYFGGIEAVIWTDFLQTITFVFGGIFCALFIIFKLPHGINDILTVANSYNKFSLGSFQLDFSHSNFWVMLFFGITILKDYTVDQSFVQRYMCAESDKEAKKSVFWSVLLCVVVAPLFLFIGTELFVYYKVFPEKLTGEISIDKIFPSFIANELPTGAKGLLLAAMLAAAMSSIDSAINSSATIFHENFNRFKILKKKSAIWILHFASFVFGTIGIAIAFVIPKVNNIVFDLWFKVIGAICGSVFGLFLLSFFSKKAEKVGAITGVIVGLTVIFVLMLGFEKQFIPVHPFMIPFIGTVVIYCVGICTSSLIKKFYVKAHQKY